MGDGGRTYWWLADRSQYGYAAELVDGPHNNREGANEAYVLAGMIGADTSKRVVVRVEQYEPDPDRVSEDFDPKPLPSELRRLTDEGGEG